MKMKGKVAVVLVGMMGMSMVGAEMRVFTNKEGKTLEAELLLVEKDKAVLKLGNGKQAKVAMNTLSDADQDFIKTWWEENKDKIKPTDVTLTLEVKTGNMKRRYYNNPDQEMSDGSTATVREYYYSVDRHYVGEVKNISGKDLKNVSMKYTMYIAHNRGERAMGMPPIKRIEITRDIELLRNAAIETFETEKVTTSSTSRENAASGADTNPSNLLGITVTLSAGGKEFLTVHDPEKLPELIKMKEAK